MPYAPVIKRFLAGILVITCSVLANATHATDTIPSILGTFNGTKNELCSSPFESATSGLQITLDTQNGGSFSGLATDGIGPPSDFSGTIDAAGNISNGVFSDSETSGTFTGRLSGDVLSIDYLGADLVPGCVSFTGSFTGTRGAIGSQSAGTVRLGEAVVRQGNVDYANALGIRQNTVRRALLGQAPGANGATVVGNGLMFQSEQLGAAAGDAWDLPWGTWAMVQYSSFEDDFAATAYDADRYAVIVGADLSLTDNFVFGVSLGYEDANIDTLFNNGEQDLHGFTVAPYFGALLPDFGLNFDTTIDMSVGYGNLSIDQFRGAGAARVTSDVDIDRYFFIGNLNATRQLGFINATGSLGVIVARDKHGAFTESDGTSIAAQRFEFAQLRLGGDFSYSMGSWEPYLNAIYAYDYERETLVVAAGAQPDNDRDDLQLGLGLRWFGSEYLSATVEYNTILLREDYTSHGMQLLLRADF